MMSSLGNLSSDYALLNAHHALHNLLIFFPRLKQVRIKN